MSHYHLEIVGNTLKVDFGERLTSGHILVRYVESKLEELIKNEQLPGGLLLKIYGRTSVLLSYTIAHKVGHLYRTIAVADTRLGAYVVVISTNANYQVGSRIDFETETLKNVFPESFPQEPAFLLSWQEDVLQARLNRSVQVDGDVIVREVSRQLEYLENNEQLKGKKLLKINGRTSILASFVMANYLEHLYGAIAVHDPKIGTHENDKYVVVISHDPDYPVGTSIDVPNQVLSNLKVVLCGAANVGKTCLREGLRQALQQLPQAPDSYIISGCPDGDGAWFSQTAQKYPELAKELKRKYKASFTPAFAQAKAREIAVIKTPILVFDVGGKISPENEVIMAQATHGVILAKTEAEVKQWQALCQALKLPIIAIIMSDYEGIEDKILKTSSFLLEGTIHHLDRHQDVSKRPMIQALAQLLSDLTVND